MHLLLVQKLSPQPFLNGISSRSGFYPKMSLQPPRKPASTKSRGSEFFEQQNFARSPDSPFSPQPSAAALPGRIYVGHSIYKGKAALTVEPRAPEFTPLDVYFRRLINSFVGAHNNFVAVTHLLGAAGLHLTAKWTVLQNVEIVLAYLLSIDNVLFSV
ncbi:Single-stranded DNA-binding protein why1, chloroplastic [Asimina triloba]